MYEEHNLLLNPVDILSIDNMFLECEIAQRTKFKRKRSGLMRSFTMDVYPVTNTLEN